MPQGELAIVLHTHMPYVESGGRAWPEGGLAADLDRLAAYLRDPNGNAGDQEPSILQYPEARCS
jgi:hypothetical protein